MDPITRDLLLTLLAWAAAVGLSPYAALALPGLGSWLGLLSLPPPLDGLTSPTVWGALVILALADALMSRFRLTDLMWSALHSLVKPTAAILLAASATAQASRALGWILALAALLVALCVHIDVLAVRTAAHTAGPSPWSRGFTTLRLFGAAALGGLALVAPPYAVAGAAVLLAGPLPWSPRLWGAARLTHAAVLAALTRPNRLHAWETGGARLSRRLRQAVAVELGSYRGPIRSARVTLARLGGRWPYLRGHLVVIPTGPYLFAHRRAFRPSVVRLSPGAGSADHQPLIETVEVEASTSYAVCLGPDAPSGPAILAALSGGGEV